MHRDDSDFIDYYAARAPAMRRLAFALAGDWHTADDLVQTTFVKLYRRWGGVRPESKDAYTRRIVVNTFLSHRHSRRREQVVAEIPDRPALMTTEVHREDVATALAALPARQRAAVVLRFLEDLPVADVAELLGVAEGTVKSQTARGVDALRRALGVPALNKEK